MSLTELASHIGMDVREVQRLATHGTLPGQQVGGKWRFHRAELLDWLQREMHDLEPRQIQNLERAMSDEPDARIISAMLPPTGVELNLPARSRTSLLRELVSVADRTGLLYDSVALLEALERREGLQSTGLAGGFAFPHPRRPLPDATAEPLVCIARVPAGIPFGAPDGRTTDLFVLVCCHDERHHLRTLARLALLFSTDLPDRLREATDAAQAMDAIEAHEQQLLDERRRE